MKTLLLLLVMLALLAGCEKTEPAQNNPYLVNIGCGNLSNEVTPAWLNLTVNGETTLVWPQGDEFTYFIADSLNVKAELINPAITDTVVMQIKVNGIVKYKGKGNSNLTYISLIEW